MNLGTNITVAISKLDRAFGNQRVLYGLDLCVHEGELVALYGPSGSGKTTLLNLIGALDHPTQGEISVLGKDIVTMRDRRRVAMRRKNIGFIFQSATLIPTYTATENIDLALRLLGLGFFERRKRAKATLQAVGLTPWAHHMPDEMSGGQRQRVAIARALALRSPIVLADEPTSGLDTTNTRQIMGLFRGIAQADGTSFLIVTHDSMLVEFVDIAYDLVEGKVVPRHKTSSNAQTEISVDEELG